MGKRMITREFKYEFLEMLAMSETIPENVEIMVDNVEHHGLTDYSEMVFKLVDEWKFYRVHIQYHATRTSLKFSTAALDAWVENDVIECEEVVPRVKQIVVYEEAEEMKGFTKMVEPLISRQTYMGMIISEYPVDGGNTFWLEGCQCTNMSAENLKEWTRRYDADEILVEFGADTCKIVDDRIDSIWLHKDVVYT